MENLRGKLAIVTGVGRLKGIGAAVCRELASCGADIFFTHWRQYDQMMPWESREREPAILQAELEALGVSCHHLNLDLSLTPSIKKVFEEAEALCDRPADILVNNATHSVNDNIYTITEQSLDQHYAVNVRATTLLCAEFAKRFTGDEGRIINLTTGWSGGRMPEEISYVITKAAIESLTHTLASVLAAKQITINAVNPGPNDTGWMSPELKRELLPRFPMGRIGQPQDTAKLIGFLASKEAQWITGQVIHSEGGFTRD